MTTTRPRAVLLHAMAGRARLRLLEPAESESLIASIAAALRTHPSVRDVEANALTGSLLIQHDGELAPILVYAQQRELFALAQAPRRAPMRQLRQAIERLDERIAAHTGDQVRLGTVAFLSLVGAGLWQAKQGRFLPAGLTLLNYGLELMNWTAEKESTISPHRS